ncbi:hypothetical protein RGUI_1265 [Rhodovulum sp. P5]|nr:hypothetical protein RGUI_1265 [Rhodovulum sp. P5]
MRSAEDLVKLAAAMVLAALVSGCGDSLEPDGAPIQLPEECEPGVGEISEMGTVVPSQC